MTDRLSLGPLPSTKTIKLTVTLSAPLCADLDQYAAIHSEVWREAVDGAALVPHIIEQFLKRDRQFKRWKRARAAAGAGVSRADAKR